MTIEIRVPQLPESVSDATLVNWHRSAGDPVRRDEKLVELETDKVVLEVPSPSDGILREVRVADGATVMAGEILALLEPGEASGASAGQAGGTDVSGASAERAGETDVTQVSTEQAGERRASGSELPGDGASAVSEVTSERMSATQADDNDTLDRAGPAVRRLMREHRVDPHAIRGTGRGGRITKSDVLDFIARDSDSAGGLKSDAPGEAQTGSSVGSAPSTGSTPSTDLSSSPPSAPSPPSTQSPRKAPSASGAPSTPGVPSVSSASSIPGASSAPGASLDQRAEQRVPMTRLRARIAERLVEAQHTAAMLTTFNEVDMSAVIAARKRYGELFKRRHEVKLGFMSFFIKASVEALRRFPVLNASVDGRDIVYHEYFDIGVAVSTDRGLVVPILRNAEQMSYADIEKSIVDFGTRARSGGLGMQDLTGGTFTITNGGIFGSMMSTPIINPPQSGILGMHSIQQRPVVVDGEIEVRPMMYLALTYDHRIVDGREAVQFLVAIKDVLEDPARLLLQV